MSKDPESGTRASDPSRSGLFGRFASRTPGPSATPIDQLLAVQHDAVFVCSVEGSALYVSPAFERATGSNFERLQAQGFESVMHPEDMQTFRSSITQAVRNGMALIEVRLSTPDGHWLPYEIALTDALDSPDIRGVVASAREVRSRTASLTASSTRRREVEEVGARLAERYLEVGPDELDETTHWALEQIARFANADGAFLSEINDLTRTDRITHAWFDRRAGSAAWNRQPRPIGEGYMEFASPRTPLVSIAEVDDEHNPDLLLGMGVKGLLVLPIHLQGTLVGTVGLITTRAAGVWTPDVVDLLRRFGQVVVGADARASAVLALKENEARFRSLVENASDMVMVLDARLNPVFLSPAVHRQTGFDDAYLREHFRTYVLHPDDVSALRSAVVSATTTGQGGADFRLRTTDGGWLSIEATITNALEERAVQGLIVNGRDVTERRRAEEALELQRERDEVVMTLSRLFLDTPIAEQDVAIDNALATLGTFLGVSHSYVNELEGDGRLISRTHEWAAAGVSSDLDIFHKADLKHVGTFVDRMRNGEGTVATTVVAIENRSHRSLLEGLNVSAVAEAPLAVGGELLGTLGIDTVDPVRNWNEGDLSTLRSVAELVASALERRRVFAALQASETQYRALVDFGSEMVLVLDPSAAVTFASPAAKSLLGFEPAALAGRPVIDLVNVEDVELFQAVLESAQREGQGTTDIRVRMKHANGSDVWVGMSVTNMMGTASVDGVVLEVRDITQQRAMEGHLKQQVRTDQLTTLPNRTALDETLRQLLVDDSDVAVMFLDLDGFKAVNDTYGHQAGDDVLTEVASLTSGVTRPQDLVARYAGDEFVLVCKGVDGEDMCRRIAGRVFAAFESPVQFGDGHHAEIGVSIGVALSMGEAVDPGTLIRRADNAMYDAKRAGKARLTFAHLGPKNAELGADLAKTVDS